MRLPEAAPAPCVDVINGWHLFISYLFFILVAIHVFLLMTLISAFQTMVSMETVLEDLKGGNKQHPMLVAKGSRGAVEQVYLTVEGQAIEIERGGLLFGLEKLMKVYFVMQMAYPPECFHVLQFLQNAVLSVNDGVPMTCRSALDLTQYVRSGRK